MVNENDMNHMTMTIGSPVSPFDLFLYLLFKGCAIIDTMFPILTQYDEDIHSSALKEVVGLKVAV